jgi:hypothetical protein
MKNGAKPRLRHEFVGMMFAIAIGEVGLQSAALVRSGHYLHFLPAYSHLFFATIVIATSWVGWSVSAAPGARRDVTEVYQWEFIVLLIDVALVIIYFILVRTIDFSESGAPPRIDPASTVAAWVFWAFCLYLVWDFITKVVIYIRDRDRGKWRDTELKTWWVFYGLRIIPTIVCVVIAAIVWGAVGMSDRPHYLTADVALLFLVLLFRSLKQLIALIYPGDAEAQKKERWLHPKALLCAWSAVCILVVAYGTLATRYACCLPGNLVVSIDTPIGSKVAPKRARTVGDRWDPP